MTEIKKVTFDDLNKINVNAHIEKKGKFSYLSWTFAVTELLKADPSATWNFFDPVYFGKTVMVYCEVEALGKRMKMHLPVMNQRNESVIDPDSRKISDAMMRCLVKCIACFGIGLYIYAGEDVPEGEDSPPPPNVPSYNTSMKPPITEPAKPNVQAPPSKSKVFIMTFGKEYKGKNMYDFPKDKINGFANWVIDKAHKDGKKIEGDVAKFIEAAQHYCADLNHAPQSDYDNFDPYHQG